MRSGFRLSSLAIALAVGAAFTFGPYTMASAQTATAAASAPGAVGAAALVEVTAHVTHIDPNTNSVTLRGPRGDETVVDVAPEIGDVKKLKVGDEVHIAYKGALLLSADKVDAKGIRSRVENEATIPASGGGTAQVKSVQVVATVQKIDRKNRVVTLRGPRRSVMLQVAPDVPLEKLKVGDSIKADYEAAAAVQVTRNGAPIQ
jgi:Cu/Ag efflux protein CusF